MRSYRFARRSFLQSVGAGAVGLRTMLRTLEASAQGATSPPRFLVTHWPVGTIHYMFRATGSGTTYTTSKILQPFETAGLRNDMIVLYGLQTSSMASNGGGGHEAGTCKTMTGANCPGTRKNGGEGDDAAAGGPSWDQIFLKNVAALKTPGVGYANAICDARVDSLETSTQCLSYGYTTRSIASVNPPNGMITENIPLLPTLSPLNLFKQLFSGFMPGGGGGSTADMAMLLKARKSVLDFSLSQLAAIKALAPASEAAKIDAHGDAIRKIETQLTTQINNGTMTPTTCTPPAMPDATLTGKTGSKFDYMNVPTKTTIDDSPQHAQIGAAHMGIIRTAFQCDLIRVATFQWSPGTNHVSFKDLLPNQPAGSIFMHHPTSHVITNGADVMTTLPAAGMFQDVVNFLANVQIWYNTQTAALINTFKNTTDVLGGNLLANTIIPYVTEVAMTTHQQNPLPAMIFGGSALGMKGGQYLEF